MRKKEIMAILLLYIGGVVVGIDNYNTHKIPAYSKVDKQDYESTYKRMYDEVKDFEECKRQEYVQQKVEELRSEKERIRLEEEKQKQQEERVSQVMSRGGDVPSGREIDVEVSWYCACTQCCAGGSGITASGLPCTENLTIAMPSEFPFGTKILIDGIVYECMDTGSYIQTVGDVVRVDIYTESHQTALEKGRYRTTGVILN